MANYRIPKNVSSELKINKSLYLTDLGILIIMLVFTMVFQNIVYSSFKYIFYIFMAAVGLTIIVRPTTNPKKRMYEAVFLALRRKTDTYISIDYEVDETDFENQENKGEL